jgi:hypothetical protein
MVCQVIHIVKNKLLALQTMFLIPVLEGTKCGAFLPLGETSLVL